MSGSLSDWWYEIRTMSRGQLLLRALVVLAAGFFGLLLALASPSGAGLVLLTLGVGLLCAAVPASLVPSLGILYLMTSWGIGVQDPWTPALLPAACSLLVLHSGCALAAAVPSQSALPAALARRQAGRISVVAALTTVAWGLAWLGSRTQTPGGVSVPAIALAVLVAVTAGHYVALTRRRETR